MHEPKNTELYNEHQVHNETENLSGKSDNSKRRLKTELTFFAILLIGALGGLFWWYQTSANVTEPRADNARETFQTNVSSIYYALKEGKTTQVLRYSPSTGSSESIFSFEESTELDPLSGNYWSGLSASASGASDNTLITYIENDNLIIYNVVDQTKNVVIKRVGETEYVEGIDMLKLEPEIVGQGPGVFGIYSPQLSQDNTIVGFMIGHYEGRSAAAIRISDKKQLDLKDAFWYLDEKSLLDRFTIIMQNRILAKHRLLPDFLVEEKGMLLGSLFSDDGASIYSIICPLDRPDTGHYTYIGELEEQQGSRRDCGEKDDRTLIEINTSDGTYNELAKNQYAFSMAMHGGQIFLALNEDRDFGIETFNLSGNVAGIIDISATEGLMEADINHVRVSNLSLPIAEVYYHLDGKDYLSLIDLTARAQIAKIELPDVSAFKTLIVQQ
jgi:hypothetical protein